MQWNTLQFSTAKRNDTFPAKRKSHYWLIGERWWPVRFTTCSQEALNLNMIHSSSAQPRFLSNWPVWVWPICSWASVNPDHFTGVCVLGGGVVKQLAVPWRITLTISCIVGRLLFLCQWQKNVFCERASTFFFIHLFPFGWEKFGWRFSTLFSNPGRLQGNNHFSWN